MCIAIFTYSYQLVSLEEFVDFGPPPPPNQQPPSPHPPDEQPPAEEPQHR